MAKGGLAGGSRGVHEARIRGRVTGRPVLCCAGPGQTSWRPTMSLEGWQVSVRTARCTATGAPLSIEDDRDAITAGAPRLVDAMVTLMNRWRPSATHMPLPRES